MTTLEIHAEISGVVVELLVQEGKHIQEGDELLVLEAMKMEMPILAPRNGKVSRIAVGENDTVEQGQLIVVISF